MGPSWLFGVHCLIGKQDGDDGGGGGSTARPAVVHNKVCVRVCTQRSLLVICFPAPYLIFPDGAH